MVMGVREICNSRLVLEVNTGKEVPVSSRLELLRKVFSEQFCFIRCRRQHIWAGGCNRFTFVENTITNSLKVPTAKFLGSDGIFFNESFVLSAYASLAASRTFLQWLLAYLNFTLNSKDFCWHKRKKWFLWATVAAKVAAKVVENHGDEWSLTWYLRWRIYTSIPETNHKIY